MITEVNAKVDEVLLNELDSLGTLDQAQRNARIDSISKLYKERVGYEKLNSDETIEYKKCNNAVQLAEIEQQNSKKDRIWNVVIRGLEIGIPTVTTCVWMQKGLEFEKTGSLVSPVFRNFWSKIGFRK